MSRDLDAADTAHAVIADGNGDMIDIYTVDGKTFIGTRATGQEDGIAVHVNRSAALLLVAALIRRVLGVSPGRTCEPTGVEGHGQIEYGYACNGCKRMSADEDDPCPDCSIGYALREAGIN